MLYEIKKDCDHGIITINYLYKNEKEKLNLDSYKLLKKKELELLKLLETIAGCSEKVKIILHKKDNSSEEITLSQLEDIIKGS